MKREWMLIGLCGILLTCGGCLSRAIKEGYGGVRGGKGAVTPLMAAPAAAEPAPLADYRRFELGTFEDDMYGKAPDSLFLALPAEFIEALAEKNLPNAPSGKTLLVRGRILHYETAGLFGELFGPMEEVIARVEYVDKDSGKVLAVANCVGRTNESLTKGVPTKAEGLARGIVEWIDSNYPEQRGQ
jgi:hypothetical protein